MTTLEGVAVEVRATLPGSPAQVFALLTDVERMAGLGPEHAAAAWQDERRGVGAVFTGSNVRDGRSWDVPCTVTAWEPPRAFAWLVGDPACPSATWAYDLQADGDGTVVTQTFRHGPGFTFLRRVVEKHPERAAEAVAFRSAELERNMRAVLAAAADLLRER